MKHLLRYALWPGLFGLAGLVLFHSRKPEPTTAATEPSPAVLPAAGFAEDAAPLVTNHEASTGSAGDETPAFESGWVREVRELRAAAAIAPDAALARVAQMGDKHERKSAAKVVCLVVAEQDPAKAMRAAWSLELGKFSDESTENTAVETLAKRWAEVDWAKAFTWASALPVDDEGRRDRVVKGIASALAHVAPAEAAQMVARHIQPDSTVHIDAAIDVLRTWAAHEYTGAVAWASRFPEGALRERGIEELAGVEPVQSPPAGWP